MPYYILDKYQLMLKSKSCLRKTPPAQQCNLPNQLFCLVTTSQPRTKVNISLADICVLRQLLLCGPDLAFRSLFLLVVFCDDISCNLLEVQWSLLHLGVQLAVDEDAGVEVLLCGVAEDFVFGHDALVHGVDVLEGFSW